MNNKMPNKYIQDYKKTLYTEQNGYPVLNSPIYPGSFFNKLTVCYGASNCGKTTIMRQIAHCLRKLIFKFYIISPSEPTNESYTGMTPAPAIIIDISKKSITDFFTTFFEEQTEEMTIYKRAININVLESIFKMIEDSTSREKIEKLQSKIALFNKYKKILSGKNKITPKIEISLEMINWKLFYYDLMLKRKYVKYIHRKSDILIKAKLKPNQKYTMENLTLNPYSLLFVDDALAEMCGYITKSSDWFTRVFTRIRHVGGTVVIAAHDDTNLLPPLRRNVFISIYCSEEIVNTNAARGGNWSKEEIKRLPEYSKTIFGYNRFAKFVIHREAKYKIRYMIADKLPVENEEIADKLFFKYMIKAYGDTILSSCNSDKTKKKKI